MCPKSRSITYTNFPQRRWLILGTLLLVLGLTHSGSAQAHFVPPEKLHPVADSYRRMTFLLQLNPVLWTEVESATSIVATGLAEVADGDAKDYRRSTAEALAPVRDRSGQPVEAALRKSTAETLFTLSTQAVARALRLHLDQARQNLDDHKTASYHLDQARQIWAAFEPEIRATDPQAFRRLGKCWLELSSALGHPGIYGVGRQEPKDDVFAAEASEVAAYLETSFGDRVQVPKIMPFRPIPMHSPTFDRRAVVPPRLPPGSDINKQLPRPRQVLSMASRGVDESETPLIALGDMAFDSSVIFGEPARSLGVTCNTCHNKSITNPGFFIPGLSSRPGNVDVSNSFFAPHASNGLFDPIDIPDLRGIRFTAPYGRNGRFASLREFTRNVIVNEFNGPEPDATLLDGMIAYMLEFDFLSNPQLAADGRLNEQASAAARRGEELFNRPLTGLGNRSCATCHVPSDQFLDRRRHDIGTVTGFEPSSRDRALDTPTLLSARYTAPYFHDGSQPTLRAVNEWFNERFELGLTEQELTDLTAYVETVGDGGEAYEDTIHTLEAELEEFSFFLSAYEFLRQKDENELIAITFETIAYEIRAHKWDVQDQAYLPVLDRLAELMDQAYEAERGGDRQGVAATVTAYRQLYEKNAEVLR